MQIIRDKNSMQKVYQCKCYGTRGDGILMQIPRCYTGYEIYGCNKAQCSTSSFRSLTRPPGRWRWYLDSSYYCYAGKHKYRAVPHMLSAKLTLIAVCGDIALWLYNSKHKILFGARKLWWAITNKINYFKNYKDNKATQACLKRWKKL